MEQSAKKDGQIKILEDELVRCIFEDSVFFVSSPFVFRTLQKMI